MTTNIIPFASPRLLPGFSVSAMTAASPARVKALDELQSLFQRKPAAAREAAEVPATAKIKDLPKIQIITRGNAALKKLTGFIGAGQLATVKQCLRGEEGQWFMEKMEELAAIVESMPVTYGQDGKGDDAICYLHYFGGSYDGYITEKDMTEPETPEEAQWQAHGYVHWAQNGAHLSMGYICLPELFKSRIELDFHFTPTTVREIKRKYGVAVTEPAASEDCLNSDSNSDSGDDAAPTPMPPSTIDKWEPGRLFISLRRIECPVDEPDHGRYDSFDTAWECLKAWAQTAPEDPDCYDKCSLEITFPDGQTLSYRYDLTNDGSDSNTGEDLRTGVLHHLMFYAGKRKPEWMIRDDAPYKYETEPHPDSVAILAAWTDLITGSADPAAPTENPLVARQKEFLAMPDGYQAGAIISYCWGWEQTNYNFYRIEKRSGEWVTLIPLCSTSTSTRDMHTDEFPTDTPKDPATSHDPAWRDRQKAIKNPTFRRKLAIHDGKPSGFAIGSGLGWANLWNGSAGNATHYA
jgi:hypothetical protein